MTIRCKSGFLLAGLVLAASAASAQDPLPITLAGDIERGEDLAYTCTGCHGVDSAVNVYPTYHVPKLGGQNADYIEVALQDYRNGLREHPTMQSHGSQLSDQDIADLSAFFASVEGEPETGISSADEDDYADIGDIVALCQSCHGADGIAPADQWPDLAGQHESYLLESMLQYQRGERTSLVMAPLVSQYDEETLRKIAAYYAAMPGLYQTDR